MAKKKVGKLEGTKKWKPSGTDAPAMAAIRMLVLMIERRALEMYLTERASFDADISPILTEAYKALGRRQGGLQALVRCPPHSVWCPSMGVCTAMGCEDDVITDPMDG